MGQWGGDGVSRHINCAHPSQNSLAVPRILALGFSRPHPFWAPFSPLFIYRAKPSKKIFSGNPHAARAPRQAPRGPPLACHAGPFFTRPTSIFGFLNPGYLRLPHPNLGLKKYEAWITD